MPTDISAEAVMEANKLVSHTKNQDKMFLIFNLCLSDTQSTKDKFKW